MQQAVCVRVGVLCGMKKSYARTLSCVPPGSTDVEEIIAGIKGKYHKICNPETAAVILEQLESLSLVAKTCDDGKTWRRTIEGSEELAFIENNSPNMLAATTSPNQPMHA